MMMFIDKKINTIAQKLNELKTVNSEKVEYTFIEQSEYKTTNTPPNDNENWQNATTHTIYSGLDNHYWLHTKLKTPELDDNKEVRLSVKTGREGKWDATNPQFTVYVNGVTTQALDVNHTYLPLDKNKEYDIYMYLYTGMTGGYFEIDMSLETVDLRVESLYYDINVPYLCMKELDDTSYEYIQIRDALDKATLKLDLRDFYSDEFYKSIDDAAKYLKDEFYLKICGNTEKKLCCIGHTHIDVAWLWTVAQTREKAQRSFSTVLNLMNKYEDYIFMSSQPQLYQHVKEADGELYEKIKQAVKEGRWEVEGAMWLEADTNLVSGESLIRQVMYGKKFIKDEFGIDSEILWLPDVFGYSGALPQILKKCGVDKFFTAKMDWNDTNKMPDDIFVWEGIDGSKVFAVLIPGYVNRLNPDRITKFWNDFKNKSLSNEAFITFGYGDGGGGPTYEMLENHKRLKYGIPGMPKTEIVRAGDYFERIQKDFEKNTQELKYTPKWIGEMYFERHRGTYTSIAKNKKKNRQSELTTLSAEALATINMVLNGGKYPTDTLTENTRTILLNQFHDIIPGSSIKEVYDVTDKEYEKILDDNKNIIENALESIAKNIKTDGGILVYNPSPFDVSGCVESEGKTYYAKKVPAHGWKVIEKKEADNKVLATEKTIENELIKIEFDEKYHIISVYDKEENREIISCGESANVFEVYEDYPSNHDAWELEYYYKQKKWIADDVSNVSILKNGLRIERKYGKSTFVQDIILNENSKRIDFNTEIDWNEDHVFLKTVFPVDIRNSFATYEIQFGNVERPTHRNTKIDAAKFEVCAHKWMDLSEANYGVSILNDSKYGCSVEENVMSLSLLKASTYPNPSADREKHKFTYSLYPHKGDYRSGNTVKEAYKLNMPLIANEILKNDGTLLDNYAIVQSDKDNVVIETIKKCENDDSVIVRVYDAYNQKSVASISANFDFDKVYLCDALENNIEEISHENNSVKVPVKNFEIVTLKFTR